MFANVALQKASINDGVFTYAIPEHLQKNLRPGMLVRVPYRTMEVIGVVTSLTTTCTYKKIREISEVYAQTPKLTFAQCGLVHHIASYYYAPINTVVRLCLPKALWDPQFQARRLHAYHLQKPDYTPAPNATKEQALLELFAQHQPITDQHLKEHGFTPSNLKNLLTKEVISVQEGPIRTHLKEVSKPSSLSTLSPAQKEAFQQILKHNGTSLLHGLTGSGKTEIYMHLVDHHLNQGKQSIMLVPEIALTPQMLRKFQSVFGDQIAVIHSYLTPKERAEEWLRVYTKEATIVIGSRSALFAPIQDYGIIIIDEENDWSYKNGETPRYHAKNAAEHLAATTQCQLLLGSATPAVESYYDATQGTYQLVTLQEKYY